MKKSSSAKQDYEGAVGVVKRLREKGFQAFLVGGCVRDKLLGRVPREYDIATGATPEQVMEIFQRTVPVGAQFGVIIVLFKGGEYEVATFRAEGQYTDGRRPDSISFVSAQEDVLRRDLTVNGLLEDPLSGTIKDFVGGRDDLAAGVVRAIGNPIERFTEDHLRILRALRFAATLEFEIDPNTLSAAKQMADSVNNVAAERIHKELSRSFAEGSAKRAYDLLIETGVLRVVLPQADFSNTKHVSAVFGMLGSCDFATALAAMIPTAKATLVNDLGQQLKLSTVEKNHLQYLLTALPTFAKERSHADEIRFVRHKMWPLAARLHGAQRKAAALDTQRLERLEKLLADASQETLHPPRLLNGNDLQKMGIKPGPHFKTLLESLETEQLEGRVETREQAEELIAKLTN